MKTEAWRKRNQQLSLAVDVYTRWSHTNSRYEAYCPAYTIAGIGKSNASALDDLTSNIAHRLRARTMMWEQKQKEKA